eukprot:EST43499.1 Hypothetical protein SS50377_16531 [Spironucleus salmonicida]
MPPNLDVFSLQETLNEAKAKMQQMRAQVEFSDKELNDLKNYLKLQTCPSCAQKVDQIQLNAGEIEQLERENSALKTELENARNAAEALRVKGHENSALDFKLTQIQNIINARKRKDEAQRAASGQGAAQRQQTDQFGAISEPFTEVAEERLEAEGA